MKVAPKKWVQLEFNFDAPKNEAAPNQREETKNEDANWGNVPKQRLGKADGAVGSEGGKEL